MKKFLIGMKVRFNSARRCLSAKKFFLMSWKKDGDDILFSITHKGADLAEVLHRIRVDAIDMVQDKIDEEDAIFEAKQILR